MVTNKYLRRFFCIILVFAMLVPANTVLAVKPTPMTDLQLLGIESAKMITGTSEEKRPEIVSKSYITYLDESLFYKDDASHPRAVTNYTLVYDNHGTTKHHRDKVRFKIRQVGEGDGTLFTLVNGNIVKPAPPISEIVNVYPFMKDHTYTFTRADFDSEAPYTIYHINHIGSSPAGIDTVYTRFEIDIFVYWDDSDLPDAPNVAVAYDANAKKYVLIGADSSMEYRLRNSGPWKACTDEPVYLNCLEGKEAFYFVRYKATDEAPASQIYEVKLPKGPYRPSASYSKSTELLTNLTPAMELRVDDGPYTDVPGPEWDLSSMISAIPAGSTRTVNVRYKATDKEPASTDRTYTLYPRGEAPSGVIFNPVTLSISGYATGMEYKGDADTSWKSLSGTSKSLESYANGERDVEVYVRRKAVSDASASLPITITIPKLVSGPLGRLDYASEMVIGLSNGNYQYSTSGTSWSKLTISNGTWNISSFITSSAKTLYLRNTATDTSPVSEATKFELPARLAAPATPAFVYNDPNYPGKAVLTGLSAGEEYRSNAETTWTPVTGNSGIVFDIPASSTTYYIRTAATNQSFASANKSLSLYAIGSAPRCSYSTATELITSLSTSMEMKIGEGQYQPVTETTFSASDLINNLSTGESVTIYVRYAATEAKPASNYLSYTLYPRSARPTGLVYNNSTNSVTGCSNSMQYRLETATSWTSISGSTLNLQSYAKTDTDLKVYIRMKPTSTAAASLPVEFTIPQMLAGPTGTIDYRSESIVGLTNGNYQYSTNASSWTNLAISDGKWDISTLLSTSAKTLYLRKAATDTDPITNYTTFKVAARPAAPSTPVFVYNDPAHPEKAVLNGLSAAMEYRRSTDTAWTDITSEDGIVFDIPTSSVTYYVRSKSTSEAFSSANRSIALVTTASAPSSSYNSTTEKITSLSTNMEMKIGNGAYTPVTETTFVTTDLIEGLSAGQSVEISVRYMATATKPASKAKSFTLYPRSASPSTLVYNYGANSVTGCSRTMEYRLETSTGWASISGSTLNLQSYVKTDTDLKVYIRTKATATSAASLPVEFTIPKMLAGPAGEINFLSESITGLANGNYQYSTTGSSWINLTVTNGSWDISDLLKTSSRTLYLRKAATDTTPITDRTAFMIPARPSYPSSPSFVYNDSNYPDKAVMSGVTTAMEYRKSTDTTWTAVSSDNGVVFDIPSASTTYYVRYKSTETAFSSSNKSVTLSRAGSAPRCSYSSKTETISSLSTKMEMKIGNGNYVPVTETTFSVTDLIDSVPNGSTNTIRVRYMATATAPASVDWMLTINPRAKTQAADELEDDVAIFEETSTESDNTKELSAEIDTEEALEDKTETADHMSQLPALMEES